MKPAPSDPFHVDESSPWFRPEAGWPDNVPPNIDFPHITLYQMLEETVAKHADAPVIWFLDSWMTYRRFKDHVDALATALDDLGLKKGDVVGLILPNSFQYAIAYYACARQGIIVTGVNPTYKPGEVLHQLKLTDVKAIVTLDTLCHDLLVPILDQYPLEPGRIITTNIVDLVPMSPVKKFVGRMLKKIPAGARLRGSRRLKDLLRTPPRPAEVPLSPDDPHTYIMTGGTTGVPKAAVLSHFNCVSNAVQCGSWIYFAGPGYCDVGVLPLFHSFAMTAIMNLSIRQGMWMMLFPRPPKVEDLLKTICAIAPDRATFYPGAEVLFQRIADFPGIDHYPINNKIRGAASGAGPLHAHVQEEFERSTGAVLVEGYGLSEASPVVSVGPLTGFRTTGTIGLPLPGTDWKIMDMEMGQQEMPPRENGELWVAGPQVMVEYLNQPRETADAVREMNGKRWLATGDIGFMDEHGRVVINDRKKQLIKVRGFSVFPKEIEELVGAHPGVTEVAAAGLPDKEMGEIIKIWVAIRPEYRGKLTPEALRQWCKANMTHYKVPKQIQFIDDIPKTMVGKVMRRQLQEADPIFKAHQAAE